MTKRETANFRNLLLKWYRNNHRKLPWRETSDPYQIWISEVMLQQTKVKTVLRYFERFVKFFPNINILSESDYNLVLKQWEGMGYYQRARNLYRSSKIIVDKYRGRIPDNYDKFREMPGVGDYIASAVQSIAFNHPHAVVDGNVKRVLARLLLIDSPANHIKSMNIFIKNADLLLNRENPGLYNQAIMELGSVICGAKHVKCDQCPVSHLCLANKHGLQKSYPVMIKSKPLPEHHISVGIVSKKDHLLITKRKSGGLLGDLWEFPGGKMEGDETSEKTCIREIKEETNIVVGRCEFLTRVRHSYTHFKIVMDVYYCVYKSGRIKLANAVDYRWITINEIDEYAFPGANHKFIPQLKKKLNSIYSS